MKTVFLRRQGLGLESIRNVIAKMEESSSIFRVDLGNRFPSGVTHVINWGNTDINIVPTDVSLFNSTTSISEISNKGNFRKKLADANLTMFTTKSRSDALSAINSGKKLVVRPYSHFGGNRTYLAATEATLDTAIAYCGSGWYASEYIPKTNEYRVFVAQGRVVYVVEKLVDDRNAIAWNVNQGGRFVSVNFDAWNLRVVKSAIEAFNLTELDFGAVDVILDSANKPYVLEINSAPALTSDYWVFCVAKTFDYMIRNGKERLQLTTERGGWKKFIHPAMSPNAIIVGVRRTRTVRREVTRDVTDRVGYSWSLNLRVVGGRQNLTNDELLSIRQQVIETLTNTQESRGSASIAFTRQVTEYEDVEEEI